jgi:REP element-mobilizing transposase RayT
MTLPRKQLIAVEDTPYYHLVSRCVRRTFLCGVDHQSGRSYEHRRQWIEERIRILASILSIEICSYAVMSNHLHLVVKLAPQEAEYWSDTEVLTRKTSLYKGPLVAQKEIANKPLDAAEAIMLSRFVATYRERLADLSWFMKCLNEPIARQANKDDECTGHFWEARYKSQALLTEEAVLSCMAYVDLNPIRAKLCQTPEESDYTSIKARIKPTFELEKAVQSQIEAQSLMHFDLPLKPLLSFDGNITQDKQVGILFSLTDYLQLVDTTGRIVRSDKRGVIPLTLSPILDRLAISHQEWMSNAMEFEAIYQNKFARKRQSLKNTA